MGTEQTLPGQGSGGDERQDDSARLPCLVINLDRSPERLAHMARSFEAMGLGFRRVPAVDGRGLSREDVARATRPLHYRKPLIPAEVACALSHHRCWEIAAASGAPFTAIFEDDVFFAPAAATFLRDAAWIPPDADVVKIETRLIRPIVARAQRRLALGHSVARLHGSHAGTAAYILSSKGAVKLLDALPRVADAVDLMIFDFEIPDGLARSLILYQLSPALCAQGILVARDGPPILAGSTIDEEGREPASVRPRRGFGARLARRLATMAPRLALRLRLALTGRKRQFIPFG